MKSGLYLAHFEPIVDYKPDKAAGWIETDLSLDEVIVLCRDHGARAHLYYADDISRMKRITIIPPAGITSGHAYQLSCAASEREQEERRPTSWEHLLRDDFE